MARMYCNSFEVEVDWTFDNRTVNRMIFDSCLHWPLHEVDHWFVGLFVCHFIRVSFTERSALND